MSYKNILVPFFNKDRARIAFHAAAAIAKSCKAHITAVHMRQSPSRPRVVYYPLGGAYPRGAEDAYKQAEDDNAAALHQLFGELCKDQAVGAAEISEHKASMGATASWRDEKGDILDRMAKTGAACDLIVAADPDEGGGADDSPLVEALLFQTGRPLLLCPAAGLARFPERVVVAWNASPEAASALSAGLPFLAKAKLVKLLTIKEPGREDVTTDDIAATLRLHGIETTQSELELEPGEDATGVLDKEIAEAQARLVVMGAYSHNRWRQAVLGGFTRHMLRKTNVPVLMAR